MRTLALTLLISANFAAPAAALAQQDPPATADDYVCTFSGDCGDDDPARDETRPDGPRPRVTATRGFALSRPESPGERAATPSRRTDPAPRHRRARNLAGSSPAAAQAPGQRVNLRLTFETGSANLTPAARAQAEAFAQALLRPQLRNMRFMIEGHTDIVGARVRNIDLSQRRAETLAGFLVNAGVDRGRLVVRGYGPDRLLPGLPGTASENRRVEAVRIS
jgi:outer membrane protein OmpA-like peptidoglycan-associated protein